MRKLLLIAAAALAVSACGVDSVASAGSAPAPLQGTTVDEKSLLIAVDTYEVALTAIDKLVAAGVIVKGSPRALELQAYLRQVQHALNAAAFAQKAGNADSYLAALADAKAALTQAGKVLER